MGTLTLSTQPASHWLTRCNMTLCLDALCRGSFWVFLFLGSILFLFLARYVWMYGVEWLDCDGDVFIREPKLIQYRRRIEMLQLRFLPANVGSNLNATGHKRLYGSTHPLNNKAITEYNIWPGCPLLRCCQGCGWECGGDAAKFVTSGDTTLTTHTLSVRFWTIDFSWKIIENCKEAISHLRREQFISGGGGSQSPQLGNYYKQIQQEELFSISPISLSNLVSIYLKWSTDSLELFSQEVWSVS